LDANPVVNSSVNVLGKAGEWYLLEATIHVVSATASSELEVWCESGPTPTKFDDFRVLPQDASMTSYVYNEWGELSHVLDNNHLFTKYVYDEMGKLKETYKETFVNSSNPSATYGTEGIVKVSEFAYNYGANSPFTVPLTVTYSGGGIVYPEGVLNIKQGTDQSVQIFDYCNAPNLIKAFVDGIEINLAVAEHTLFDGAKLKINGNILSFNKVLSGHTLYVQYFEAPPGGTAYCSSVSGTIDGQPYICYDGGVKYRLTNICGQLLDPVQVSGWEQVPPHLQHYMPEGGCPAYGSGTNCPW
jgi:hypothetical protein